MLADKPLSLYMDVWQGCGLVDWLVGMGKQSSRYLSYSNNFGIFLIEKKRKINYEGRKWVISALSDYFTLYTTV